MGSLDGVSSITESFLVQSQEPIFTNGNGPEVENSMFAMGSREVQPWTFVDFAGGGMEVNWGLDYYVNEWVPTIWQAI